MSRFSCLAIRRTNDGFECEASLQGIAPLGRRLTSFNSSFDLPSIGLSG
jgi:hypothetical protein